MATRKKEKNPAALPALYANHRGSFAYRSNVCVNAADFALVFFSMQIPDSGNFLVVSNLQLDEKRLNSFRRRNRINMNAVPRDT